MPDPVPSITVPAWQYTRIYTVAKGSSSQGQTPMFEGFTEGMIAANGINLFVRRKGPAGAPALLLLHGYPQTSAMWHLVAPALAEQYQVVCPDLRGCGRSDAPPSDDTHSPYSKRVMAQDMVALMQTLGHERFFVGAHDRGARVAHRLGLDHPEQVRAMALLDIAPTREMYAGTTEQFAQLYWHWFMLIQKAPLPETLIGGDPDGYWKAKCFNQAGGNPFSAGALDEYLTMFRNPAVIHATCEDYRAAHGIDIQHDDEDSNRRLSVPLLVLWGRHGAIETCFDAMALWRRRAEQVEGEALDCGHYMAEELPGQITARFMAFYSKYQE